MPLDMRTLWMVIIICYALLAGLQLALWRLQPRETAMLSWGLSLLSCGVGAVLFSLRGMSPDRLSIGVGNFLTALGYLLTTGGLLRFAGRPVPWAWICVPPVLIGLTYTFVPLFLQNAGPRVVVMAVLLTVTCAANLLISGREQRREPLVLRTFAMVAFAATLLFSVIRAMITVGYAPPADFMAADPLQPLMMLIGITLVLFFSLSMMLMPGERLQNQLRRLSFEDALTNLLNRGGFNELASRQLRRCREDGQPVSVLLMDLDHFKRVNDEHGHDAGDRMLCAFAETVRAYSRPTDLLARYGGEEFCALLPNTDQGEATMVAERVRQQFSRITVPINHGMLGATVSIGVAQVAESETMDLAIQRADAALYVAKRSGRNKVALDPGPDESPVALKAAE